MKPAFYPRLFFVLYFFEGAPIGLLWWLIPTLLAQQGVTVDVITQLTALAALPWTFKFVISPLVDRYFSTVRSFAYAVATAQILMFVALLCTLTTPLLSPNFIWFALTISLFSALQDVFIDAWAIGFVPEQIRGRVNGAMQMGLLTGRWFFGAGLLLGMAFLNWQAAIGILCLLLSFSILYLYFNFARDHRRIHQVPQLLSLGAFRFAISKKFILLATVAGLSGFAFESLGAVAGPFLVANGYTKQNVGIVLSLTLLSMLAGAILGGKAADKLGSAQVFLSSGILLAVFVCALGFLNQSTFSVIFISIVLCSYFFIGSFTSSSYAFYMAQSKGSMEATRFTFLMAMTNLCEVAAAFSVGRLAAIPELSYSIAFLATSLISLVGLVVLWQNFIRRTTPQNLKEMTYGKT